MKTTHIYLMVIAMLMYVSFTNIRDSKGNTDYACYVQQRDC